MATDVAQLCDFVQTPEYSASPTDSNLDWIDLFNNESVKRKERQPFRSGGKAKGGSLYGVKGLQVTRSKLPWATTHVGLAKNAKPWPNPNPSAEPIYAAESRNIFLKLQRQRPSNRTFEFGDELGFLKPLPPPDDLDVQTVDSKYLSYFLSEVPRLLGCICCTPQMVNIFMQSVNQPILRHSILALSSAMMHTGGRLSSLYTHRNVHRIIPQIKQAITQVTIDHSHIVSVTFLAWLALTTGDLVTAQRHVRGLFSMLQLTNHLSATGEPVRRNPDPLVMFLFRMAVKADNTMGCRNQSYAIPVLNEHETYHRQWLQAATSSEVHLQYCLATINLDDIANKIGHLHQEARKLRNSGVHDDSITLRLESIMREHQEWLSRPYIQRHIRGNDDDIWNQSTKSPIQSNRFLSQRPYAIFDPLVAHMHLVHASLIIHANIVQSEHVFADESFKAAVLICRIYAALDDALGGKAGQTGSNVLTALWLAGLVFGDKTRSSPAGFQWVTQTLLEIDEGNVYCTAIKLSDALVETVRTNGDPWEIVGNIFGRRRKIGSDRGSSSPGSSVSGV